MSTVLLHGSTQGIINNLKTTIQLVNIPKANILWKMFFLI